MDLYIDSKPYLVATLCTSLTILTAFFIFIMSKVKEGLYDAEGYSQRIKLFRAFNPKLSTHGPLRGLMILFVFTLIVGLMTVGAHVFLSKSVSTELLRVMQVALAVYVLLLCLNLWAMVSTTLAWLKHASDQAEKKISGS